MLQRPRRNRQSKAIRSMVEETVVRHQDLVYPLFLVDGQNVSNPITSLPGLAQLSIDFNFKRN